MIQTDIAIVGAGAAGLAAAIFAGEAAAESSHLPQIDLVDGARRLGAKILVSGGGRCNVTHHGVTPDDFWGGPRPTIRTVLRAFDLQKTLRWMEQLGVALKREPSGKYFPVSDEARTVVDALLRRVGELGIRLRTGQRVTGIRRVGGGESAESAADSRLGRHALRFLLSAAEAPDYLECRRLIVATGGLSLPKSGSDGAGLEMLRRLGHSLVPVTPALVPLVLRQGSDVGGRFAEFSGLTLPMRIGLYLPSGKKVIEITDSLLFTHFGISGPAALNFSRHWLRAKLEHPAEVFRVCLGHPDLSTPDAADHWLQEQATQHPKRSVASALGTLYPERLARALCAGPDFASHPSSRPSSSSSGASARREDTSGPHLPAGAKAAASTLDSSVAESPLSQLSRAHRAALARRLTRLPVDVVGDRGYAFAEATAGGVDLREINPRTMESRTVPGLFLCGELLDVDGRIGGFNFQWAWSSGYLAGRAAVHSLEAPGAP